MRSRPPLIPNPENCHGFLRASRVDEESQSSPDVSRCPNFCPIQAGQEDRTQAREGSRLVDSHEEDKENSHAPLKHQEDDSASEPRRSSSAQKLPALRSRVSKSWLNGVRSQSEARSHARLRRKRSDALQRAVSESRAAIRHTEDPSLETSDLIPAPEDRAAYADASDLAEAAENATSVTDRLQGLPKNEIAAVNEVGLMSEAGSIDLDQLLEEVETRWILNLSVQFRDDTRREKLFITYAAQPNLWRRLTVTWEYANVRKGSLEEDLGSLTLQRDKSFRVYEAVRLDLPKIVFKDDTTTQLRLKTEDDDKLHIYVDVDEAEAIDFPPIGLVEHIACNRYRESEVMIDQHLSGFVYRVLVHGETMVKKEIPGPKNVDEFFYELNCIEATADCPFVVDLCGIVTDERGELVTAILISYASRGPLSDLIYDARNRPIPWTRRKMWAGQIIEGLSAIHEAGFVQGDFTLSNIVIDSDDNARIIDLNRRGCPVGWEPPELLRLFQSRQKINSMISVKSDLYQLGMVLWALAEHVDEPDRLEPDELDEYTSPEVPEWYKEITRSCLQEKPQNRLDTKTLQEMYHCGCRADEEAQRYEASSLLPSSYLDVDTYVGSEGIGEGGRRFGDLQVPKHRRGRQSLDADGHSFHEEGRSGRGVSVASSAYSRSYRPGESLRDVSHLRTTGLRHRGSRQSILSQPIQEYRRPSPRSPVFRPPLHSDSGFDELLFTGGHGMSLGLDTVNSYISPTQDDLNLSGLGDNDRFLQRDDGFAALSLSREPGGSAYVMPGNPSSAHDSALGVYLADLKKDHDQRQNERSTR